MKRMLILGLISILIFSGCSYKERNEVDVMLNSDNKNYSDEGEFMPNSDNKNYSDGVIAPMSAEELIQKLSLLNEKTKKTDLVNIFGKEPYIPIELNSVVYDYFSGDINIRLWGEPLFQAVVNYGESSFSIRLQTNESKITDPLGLNDFLKLKIGMQYDEVIGKVGEPKSTIGSGILRYVYNLKDNSKVIIGFGPYMDKLQTVIHEKIDGTQEMLLK